MYLMKNLKVTLTAMVMVMESSSSKNNICGTNSGIFNHFKCRRNVQNGLEELIVEGNLKKGSLEGKVR